MFKKLLWQLFALLFLVTGSTVSAEPIFRIVYNDKENPPRIMGDDTSINWSKPGITLELLKMVEKQVNVPFQFKRMPWKRCLYMVENGLADGTFHASYNSDICVHCGYYSNLLTLEKKQSICCSNLYFTDFH